MQRGKQCQRLARDSTRTLPGLGDNSASVAARTSPCARSSSVTHSVISCVFMTRSLRPDPHPHQDGVNAVRTCLRSVPNPQALLLGHPPEDRNEQAPHWTTSVEPRFLIGNDLDSSTVEIEDRLQGSNHAPVEAVEAPHEQYLELPSMSARDHFLELGSRLNGRDVLGECLHDLEGSAGRQGFEVGELIFGALLGGRDSEVKGCLHEGEDDCRAWSSIGDEGESGRQGFEVRAGS